MKPGGIADYITPEMKRQFQAEVDEHLDLLERMLMALEADPSDREPIPAAFRAIHSIKGNSDYLGVGDIKALAHDLEDLMDEVRNGRLSLTGEVLEVLLQGLDRLRSMNRRITDPVYREEDIRGILDRIGAVAKAAGEGPGPAHRRSLRREAAARTAAPAVEDLGRGGEWEVRIGHDRVDAFINQISELTIAKSALNDITRRISLLGLKGDWVDQLGRTAAGIDKLSGELQSEVMQLRLIKIRGLFGRLPRIVRDVARFGHKQVDLRCSGEEVEIDRKIIERLVDPLVHIIRNAVDHGLEPPEDRKRSGKPETGVITVEALQESGQVMIEVADDGRGFDIDAIKAEALRRKVRSPSALEAMGPEDLLNLVFLPGMSTASAVTPASGRGVGLDVVKNNLQLMGGTVRLSNRPGAGSRIRLQVPVSLALMESLLVETEGQVFALPVSAILRTFWVHSGEIRLLNNRETVKEDGSPLVVIPLGEILGNRRNGPRGTSRPTPVILMAFGGRRLGLMVDRILRWESVFTRPLGRLFVGVDLFAGTSLLGDGTVVLVIDPIEIFEML